MPFHRGTATDWEDLSDKVLEILANNHCSAVDSVAAGGSGYAVGDTFRQNTGTALQHTTFEVTAESAGVITAVRIFSAGAYSSNPSDGGATVTLTGGGSSCTLNTTYIATNWITRRDLDDIGLIEINSILGIGTGYVATDVLTIAGGTGTAATVTVDTVDGSGGITAISVTTHGTYTVAPATTNSPTGGTGSGASLELILDGTVGRKQVIIEGPGSGADEIVCGWYTYDDTGANAQNWELAGMTGFTQNLEWENQPNKTGGEWADQAGHPGGMYLLLNNASLTWWIAVSNRRIFIAVKVGAGTYSSCYLGFGNPFGTATELPYPMVIAAGSEVFNMRFSSNARHHSAPPDPIRTASFPGPSTGPFVFRKPDGTWQSFANSSPGTTSRTPYHTYVVYPAGQSIGLDPTGITATENRIVNNGPVHFQDIIPNTGAPGTQLARLLPSEDSDGDKVIPIPCTLVASDAPTFSIYCELEGVFWASASTTPSMAAEDRLEDANGDKYLILQMGNRTEPYSHFALKEA